MKLPSTCFPLVLLPPGSNKLRVPPGNSFARTPRETGRQAETSFAHPQSLQLIHIALAFIPFYRSFTSELRAASAP